MAKSELKYREYEKKNTDFSALKNIQDNIDAILNINIRMTNFVALKDETVKFVNDSRINYYNVTQMVKILSDYSYFFSDSMVYMFYPEKDIYIGRDSTYHDDDIIKTFGVIPYSLDYLKDKHGGCCGSSSMVSGLNDKYIVMVNKSTTIDANPVCFIIAFEKNI